MLFFAQTAAKKNPFSNPRPVEKVSRSLSLSCSPVS